MNGPNTKPFRGLPASGWTISLPGIDVFEVESDGIHVAEGCFDTRAVPDQLGLRVIVQPFQVGPFSFGNSTSVQSGKETNLGAFAITTIWNADAQTDEISP